ncbi:MAG TPA: IS66 family insertion sequence element accessory protein TnpB [Acidothermaceae bacterium]|jgi:hypothetical protein|nr:IS66 family insertion sequence element accessory protein TnpB [Acidothermaceae bacterium]
MILGTSRAVRVYAYPEAVDLRKGYDGLFGLVRQGLARDPLSGELYLFVNMPERSSEFRAVQLSDRVGSDQTPLNFCLRRRGMKPHLLPRPSSATACA